MSVQQPSSTTGKPVSSSAAITGEPTCFLRRKQAGAYLSERYGFGAARTLAKAAVSGDGPEYHKAGRVVLYTREALDKWALAKIGAARRSTSAA
jgi:hypothetical protein